MKKTATWLAALCAVLLALHVVGCDHDPDPVAVEYVSINTPVLTLTCGGTARLTATVLPEDADDKTVLWWSSDPSVATVGEDGSVTAVMAGSASITARAGDKTAECTVTVNEATVNPEPVAVETIALDKNTLTLTRGETGNLTATVLPEDADDKTVLWWSSDPSVAAVGEDGTVTAVMVGSASITAQAGDKTATCVVTVNPIPVTDITLNAPALTLTSGTAIKLTATVLPENADGVTVTWSSSDDNVATVDADGTVTTIAEGTAVITAQAGGMTAECTVSVKQILIAVETVTLNPTTLMLTRGETGKLSATVTPGNADDTTVIWSSSDPAVATVGNDGTVTAVTVGTATVTATTQEGGKTATCAVTVNPIRVGNVTLNPTTLMLMRGETGTLTATVTPEDADDTTVAWSSSDPAVATVDNDGTVTTHNAGTATITARADGKEATCAVTVKPIPVENVTLNPTTLTLMREKTGKLTATVTPENADDKTVTWSSSAPAVATVGNDGTVTAVTVGTATVTATTREGGKTATCTVTVSPIPVAAVTLNPTTLTLAPGETGKLTATVTPNNADDKTVTWSSSAPAVATVGEDGTVRAASKGTANITAKAGGKEVSCAVTVRVAVANIVLNPTTLLLARGETGKLTATVTPDNADNKTVTWSSSDEAIVTVGADGTVTAVAVGTATVTARAGGKEATCAVTVHIHSYSKCICMVCGAKLYMANGTIDDGSPDSSFEGSFEGCLTKYTGTAETVVIPDGVTAIWFRAFSGCTSLKSVEIPNSVTYIGDGAFLGCTNLASVEIPNSVTYIESRAFEECTNLASVEISDSVSRISSYAFSGCTNLVSVEIPGSVEYIGVHAFSGCTSLTSVKILDGVTSIGEKAFQVCNSLTSVEIPGSVTSIGDNAFSGCNKLSTVIYGGTKEQWEAFEGKGSLNPTCVICTDGHLGVKEVPPYLTMSGTVVTGYTDGLPAELDIPDGVTEIRWDVFHGCTDLTSVVIPDSVTSISGNAFSGCTGLTSVTMGDGVTRIGDSAFFRCTGLTSVEIPGSVTRIGVGAFYGCSGLTSVEIPGSVTRIGNDAFSKCNKLTDVHYAGTKEEWERIEGISESGLADKNIVFAK